VSFSPSDIRPRIGTRIDTDKATLLGGENAGDIRALLEQRGVLVFPQIDMSDEEQLAFARTLGQPIDQGEKGIYKVTLDPKITPSAEYLHGTFVWHFDGWADDVPALGSILSARVLSPTGGQTEFANTYAAYDTLPEEKKQAIEGLRVQHTMAGTQRDVYPNASPEMREGWSRYPGKVHPLVWTHRSGRKSLLLGSSADWVEGMNKAESDALLAELKAWSTQPQFVYRHEWQVGDMIMWDNCGCVHRVEQYRADSGRMMHRVTLEGEEAIAA
jgi:alpha-ketoglutarate-dependent taurine dioxygenase